MLRLVAEGGYQPFHLYEHRVVVADLRRGLRPARHNHRLRPHAKHARC